MTRSDIRVRLALSAWQAIKRYPRLAGALRRPARAAWQRMAPNEGQPVTPHSAAEWPFVVRDRRRGTGAILVIDDKVPEFDRHAGGVFISQMLQILVEVGIKVLFLPDDRYPRQPYTRLLQRTGIEVLHGHFDLDRWLRINGPLLDWVLMARPDVASSYISAIRRFSSAQLLYYTHDLHYLRERRRYDSTGDPEALRESERLKAIEQWIARSVDVMVTPSVDELPEIERLRPLGRVLPVPPYASPQPAAASAPPLRDRRGVIFVGGFDHVPNVHAAEMLANEIMPSVSSTLPDVHLYIVGSNPGERVAALAGDRVTVTGFVPDLQPYYDASRASVNPLFFGAGVKGKILSSIGAGVPVVTTSIGNEGIGLSDGVNVLLGETAGELAKQVLRLFEDGDLASQVAEGGLRFLEERFSRGTTRRALFEALGDAR